MFALKKTWSLQHRSNQKQPLLQPQRLGSPTYWGRQLTLFNRQLLRSVSTMATQSSSLHPITSSSPSGSDGPPLTTGKLLLVVGVALIDPGQPVGNGKGTNSRTPARVLLAQRPPGKANAGLWEFPGGKVEPGETPEGAVVRELREELGLTIHSRNLQPLSFSSWPYPNFHLLMPLYACYSWQGEPHGAEGQQIIMVTQDELQQYPLTPADVPLLPDVLRALEECNHRNKQTPKP